MFTNIEAGARRREHGQYPLRAIRRPDPDALAGLEPAGDQAARHPLHLAIEFRERQPHRLKRHHQRRVVRMRWSAAAFEHPVDAAIQQRLIAGARHETQSVSFGSRHENPLPRIRRCGARPAGPIFLRLAQLHPPDLARKWSSAASANSRRRMRLNGATRPRTYSRMERAVAASAAAPAANTTIGLGYGQAQRGPGSAPRPLPPPQGARSTRSPARTD